jgi:N6-adenosine-specific RNA methylase IME4
MAFEPYKIILSDPPWMTRSWSGDNKAQKHYKCSVVDDIAAIPVESIAAKDSLLFLWAIYPNLKDAFTLAEAWGFPQYSGLAFQWVKLNPNGITHFMGCGHTTRKNSEPVLLFRRGKGLRILSHSVRELVIEPRMNHSRKPQIVHDDIIRLVGDQRRCELFARRHTPGWDCYGLELDGVDLTTKIAEITGGGSHENDTA